LNGCFLSLCRAGESQLTSDAGVGNGHQKVAGDEQVPGILIFYEPQSVRQSSNFGSPASTSVTHAVLPADSLRGQSTYQHEEPS
jgi:hypothetical protein